jgi:hypothetical protein
VFAAPGAHHHRGPVEDRNEGGVEAVGAVSEAPWCGGGEGWSGETLAEALAGGLGAREGGDVVGVVTAEKGEEGVWFGHFGGCWW